jgi:pimeloyl-ACP methyl ester carboxylesterase
MSRELESTALVLGWAGSTERQLRLVKQHYAARGMTAIASVPDVMRAMAFPNGWAREGERVASYVVDRGGPIFVHSFSNAGFWTYAAMLRALEKTSRGRAARDRIRAVVIDSAPGFPAQLDVRFTTRASTMAVMPMLLRSMGRPPALSHRYLDAPLRAFMVLWYYASPRQIRWSEASLDVVRRTGEWPFLFLCSKADALVPYEHVESFIASLNRAHRAIVWDNSAHVRHMITHRHEYFRAIDELLGNA